jgi:hypothetical protein
MPQGAIPADLSQQLASSAFSSRNFYRDIEFTCVDCGTDEVWTAKDQKWFFEVAKGIIHSKPRRCLQCRKKMREMKAEQRVQMEGTDRARSESTGDAK